MANNLPNTAAAIRERRDQVAAMLAAGFSDERIATEVCISPRSLLRHKRAIGWQVERPRPRLSAEEIAAALRLLEDGASYEEAARTLGCASTTLRSRLPGFNLSPEDLALVASLAKRWKKLEREINRGNWRSAGKVLK